MKKKRTNEKSERGFRHKRRKKRKTFTGNEKLAPE